MTICQWLALFWVIQCLCRVKVDPIKLQSRVGFLIASDTALSQGSFRKALREERMWCKFCVYLPVSELKHHWYQSKPTFLGHSKCTMIRQLFLCTGQPAPLSIALHVILAPQSFCLGIFKYAHQLIGPRWSLYAILKCFYISTDMKYHTYYLPGTHLVVMVNIGTCWQCWDGTLFWECTRSKWRCLSISTACSINLNTLWF